MSVTLEARVDAAVQAVIERENGRLVELITRRLDEELERLVAAEIEARTLAVPEVEARDRGLERDVPLTAAPAVKTCRTCSRSEPEVRFDANRRVCRSCRHARARERRPEATGGREDRTGEPPRPGSHDHPV